MSVVPPHPLQHPAMTKGGSSYDMHLIIGIWFPVQNNLAIFNHWIACVGGIRYHRYMIWQIQFSYSMQKNFWGWLHCMTAQALSPFKNGWIQAWAGLAPSCHTVGSLLRPPFAGKAGWKKDVPGNIYHFLLNPPCTLAHYWTELFGNYRGIVLYCQSYFGPLNKPCHLGLFPTYFHSPSTSGGQNRIVPTQLLNRYRRWWVLKKKNNSV